MFPNLNAELARSEKKQVDLAMALKVIESTISDKMTGKTDFKLKECKKIIKKVLPGHTVDYLFATENEMENGVDLVSDTYRITNELYNQDLKVIIEVKL